MKSALFIGLVVTVLAGLLAFLLSGHTMASDPKTQKFFEELSITDFQCSCF